MSALEPRSFFELESTKIARVAIFISGSGTNAEKILEDWQRNQSFHSYKPVCIVTDRPERCRAEEIATAFELDFIALDIFSYYSERGLRTTSLATEEGRKIREEWTATLYEKLEDYRIDFGVFAGFIPLCNITDHFPCLNVHPGDLTVCDENGERILVGLHTLPVHLAIQNDFETMRSSVIVACAYEEEGSGMDEGHIIGISPEVEINWLGKDRQYFLQLYNSRPSEKPEGGWRDEYQDFLEKNQEKLKVHGDWVVFPKAVADFSKGFFAYQKENLFYKSREKWLPIEVIEYSSAGKEIFLKSF